MVTIRSVWPANVIGAVASGQDRRLISVTIGYIAPGVMKVWTDGWPPFIQGNVVDVGQLRRMAGLVPTIEVPSILPDGYRLWTPDDGVAPVPRLATRAHHGLVGCYLELLEDQTEAGLAPVGAIVLAHLGTLIGRRAIVTIGEHRQHANLFELVVGETSTGGKGSADNAAEALIEMVDPFFFVRHAIGGFGSGEALIEAVGDTKPDQEANEKRRIIHESEFSAVLRVARRESTILSEIIRQGFDYKPIRHRTKTSGTAISTGHHLSVIGSITPAELLRCSDELDVENGWLNRFLFIHAEISGSCPSAAPSTRPRSAPSPATSPRRSTASTPPSWACATASSPTPSWARSGSPGTTRSVSAAVPAGCGRSLVVSTSRRARLALILAVLDQAEEIRPAHLEAAIAWTDYSVATVERYFGQGPGGHEGKLLTAIRAPVLADGLSVSEQHDVFGRHLKAEELETIRTQLEHRHLIFTYAQPTWAAPERSAWPSAPCERTKKAK